MRLLYLLLTPLLLVVLLLSASLLLKASTGMEKMEWGFLTFCGLLGLPIVGHASLQAWRRMAVDDRLPQAWLMAMFAGRFFLRYAKDRGAENLFFGIVAALAFLGLLIDRLCRPTLPPPAAPPEPELAGPLRPSPHTSSGCLMVACFLLIFAMVAAVVLSR